MRFLTDLIAAVTPKRAAAGLFATVALGAGVAPAVLSVTATAAPATAVASAPGMHYETSPGMHYE